MDNAVFSGKVGLQQRVFPNYRSRFFERLAQACEGGFSLIAGGPRKSESIITTDKLQYGDFHKTRNLHLFGGRFYMCFQAGLMQWLEHLDPEILILEANPRYLSNRLAVNWMHKRGRPVVGWGLGVPAAVGAISGMQTQGRDRYLSAFDAMISYSSLGAKQYVASGMSESQVFIAVNSASPAPSKMHERGRIAGRALRILFVGRLQERKRVDNLIRACASLDQKPDLWIVGDGPEKSSLEKLASQIYPKAEFKGALEGLELEGCFKEADLFVLPGTGGLAVQEAMAYGLPVIVAAGDGTQQDLVNDQNGWLVDPGDLADIQNAIREALSDLLRLQAMGAKSYNIVRKSANIDVMTKVFIQAFEYVRFEVR
jgi:glycosyltransferase involved in cell wall biosynthesis